MRSYRPTWKKMEEDEEVDDSPPGSPTELMRSSSQKHMMSLAMHYRMRLKLQAKPEDDDLHIFAEDSDHEDTFSSFECSKARGIKIFANPYMEIFNVAMATTGMYAFNDLSKKEYENLLELSEPICYMENIDEEECTKLEKENEFNEMEVREVPKEIIYKVPIRKNIPDVATKVNGVYDVRQAPACPNQEGIELPMMMRLQIQDIVDKNMETWKFEGMLNNSSDDKIKKVSCQLQNEATTFVTSKIQDYLLGKIKINEPLPLVKENKRKKLLHKTCKRVEWQ